MAMIYTHRSHKSSYIEYNNKTLESLRSMYWKICDDFRQSHVLCAQRINNIISVRVLRCVFFFFYHRRRIMSILTNGVADYLEKKWMSREFHDQPLTEADSIGATIGHVQGLLVVFGLSVVVATVIMFVELTVSRSKNSSKNTVPRPKFPRFYQ